VAALARQYENFDFRVAFFGEGEGWTNSGNIGIAIRARPRNMGAG